MEQQTQQFFTGTNRRVIVGSPTMQASTRRICIPIRMPLTGESVIGMPSWLGEAYTAVSKFASEMTPEVEQIADIVLAFDSQKPKDGLFELPAAKVPQAELRAFNVTRAGNAEQPDVELTFKAYAPYARDFWAWLGEMAGKEVFMAFPSTLGGTVKVAESTEQMSLDAVPAPSLAEEFGPGTAQFEKQVAQSLGADKAGPRMERVDPHRPRKNGKELAAYHEEQTAQEEKSGKRKAVPAGVN